MATTTYLVGPVEQYVRAELERLYGVPFQKKILTLRTTGSHEFDAVSSDGDKIVASIKATSGKTAGGKMPQGKFNNAIAELYFLMLINAPQRILVLTNPEFHQLLLRKMKGRVPSDIAVMCIPLPAEMQARVDADLQVASKEVSPAVLEAAVESEADSVNLE